MDLIPLFDNQRKVFAEKMRHERQACAQGMSKVVKGSVLSRESLYMSFSGDRSPSFDTILKVVSASGLKLSASV